MNSIVMRHSVMLKSRIMVLVIMMESRMMMQVIMISNSGANHREHLLRSWLNMSCIGWRKINASQCFIRMGHWNDLIGKLRMIGVFVFESANMGIQIASIYSSVIVTVVSNWVLHSEIEMSHTQSVIVILGMVKNWAFVFTLDFGVESWTHVKVSVSDNVVLLKFFERFVPAESVHQHVVLVLLIESDVFWSDVSVG